MPTKVSHWFQSEKDTTITGNVHSGATPPWMTDDSGDDTSKDADGKVMGPTQEDFDKHCKAHKTDTETDAFLLFASIVRKTKP